MTKLTRAIGGSIAFALVWVALAALRPTTTFHLAPLIVAMWPTLTANDRQGSARGASVGFGIAAVVTAVLSVAGLLEGPSLLPWGGPALESLVAAGTGALLGIAQSAMRHRTPQS